MDIQSAVAYIRKRGGPQELARLDHLLDRQPASPSIVSQLLSLQRPDGGWDPFWATEYSSLDATCFRLAQAEALGIPASEPAVVQAVQFLIQQQEADGSWEESTSVENLAPPWAKPGSLPARLYLTSSCGFWIARLSSDHSHASRAADHLLTFLAPDGRLPSFLHASWLACGLWYQLRRVEHARLVLDYLDSRLVDMESSNLAWMMTTLMLAGFPPGEPVLQSAADCLDALQSEGGYWTGEDGSEQDLHTTLEAVRVLRWMGR